MEAKDDEKIVVLRSDYEDNFWVGLYVGAISGLTVMFLLYNIF